MKEIESPDDMLREDEERRRRLSMPFDPLTGLNSTGGRFRLRLSDFIIPVQYLPESMKDLPMVRSLLRLGSIREFARERGEDPVGAAESLLALRLLHDFPFWAYLTVRIKNKGGGDDVRFRLNRPQRMLTEAFERCRLAHRPIRLIVLKARQWGGSTCTQLYMAWLQLMHSKGLNSLIIAHQVAGSDEIKDMFDRMISAYDVRLLYTAQELAAFRGDISKIRKTVGVGKSGSIFRVPQRNCKIKIGTAERPDSCRGGDYSLVHLSEVGIWRATDGKSPEDIVRSACGGVLLREMTMIVYESTANGTGNFFHREYLAAMRGESQFAPLFVGWYDIDQYSIPLSADERRDIACRIWEGRESEASTSRSVSGKYLFSLFKKGATLDAIAWYVAERAKYNDDARMAAEYPSDETEAFNNSGSPVFDRYDLERMRESCTDPEATGDLLAASAAGPESLTDIHFHSSASGGMKIWRFPQTDGQITDRYLTVVDVGGRGSKADWSVVAVLDRAPMTEGGGPEIAAQWRGHCDVDELAWLAARVARYYDDALLVIESNTVETREGSRGLDAGQTPYILLQLRDAYPNIYMRGGSAEDIGSGVKWKLGFHTNTVTKPMVINTLIRVIRDSLYTERSHEAIDEMVSYERRANGSYGAIAGYHDDILMTRAIGLHIALHEMDLPRRRVTTGRRRRHSAPGNEASF